MLLEAKPNSMRFDFLQSVTTWQQHEILRPKRKLCHRILVLNSCILTRLGKTCKFVKAVFCVMLGM